MPTDHDANHTPHEETSMTTQPPDHAAATPEGTVTVAETGAGPTPRRSSPVDTG